MYVGHLKIKLNGSQVGFRLPFYKILIGSRAGAVVDILLSLVIPADTIIELYAQ